MITNYRKYNIFQKYCFAIIINYLPKKKISKKVKTFLTNDCRIVDTEIYQPILDT